MAEDGKMTSFSSSCKDDICYLWSLEWHLKRWVWNDLRISYILFFKYFLNHTTVNKLALDFIQEAPIKPWKIRALKSPFTKFNLSPLKDEKTEAQSGKRTHLNLPNLEMVILGLVKLLHSTIGLSFCFIITPKGGDAVNTFQTGYF